MTATLPLVEHFAAGLAAPICLTWELTYACNLACAHCLSSSGRRDPRELTTAEAKAVIDELQRMQVFYVNIGGGEPTVRPDFWELVDYATTHQVGVKFSTNGVRLTPEAARRIVARARAGGRDADCIVLGRDAPQEKLDHWLQVAAGVDGFVGFAIGRSIWKEALEQYLRDADEATFLETVGANYLHYVRTYLAAR
jgi:2-iminoacetate synthase ThiH